MDIPTKQTLHKNTNLSSKEVDKLIKENIHELYDLFKGELNEFYPIKQLLDKVINKKKYVAITLIHGIMDDGKTYRIKILAIWLYRKFGWRFAWLMSNKPSLNEEIGKWYEAFLNPRHLELWKDTAFEKLKDTEIWVLKDTRNDDIIGYYHTMMSIRKTGRDVRIMNAFFDEYNFGDTRYLNLLPRTTQTFISRNLRPGFRMWMIGNSTTYNISLLYEWGLFEKPKTEFHYHNLKTKEGFPSKSNILVHEFSREKDHADKKYSDVGMYDVLRATEFGKHAFDNESLLDDVNHVVNVEELNQMGVDKYETLHTIFTEGVLLDINYITLLSGRTFYYVCDSEWEKERVEIAFHIDDSADGIPYEEVRPMELARQFQLNNVYYESIVAKQKVYRIIKRFIRKGIER